MSSSPPGERGVGGVGNDTARTVRVVDQPAAAHSRSRRFIRRPLSLRARLVATQIFLLAMVCLALGLSTQFALQHFLYQQLDGQLLAAANRAAYRVAHALPTDRPGNGLTGSLPPPTGSGFRPPAQTPDTLEAHISVGGAFSATYVGANGYPQTVPSAEDTVLQSVPIDGRHHTATLGSLGDYRVTAIRARDGSVLITGIPLGDVQAILLTSELILGGAAGVGLLAAGVAGTILVRRTMRPLQRVADTASHVVELPLHRGTVPLEVRVAESDADPRTEVGQVGAALNQLLGHVGEALRVRQASEMRVRQFVADASHELRTPLAAIRGYAELTRRSRDAVPAEVAHAMRRVESESARMGMLVEDLLLLARLDSGRPLDHQPVDLTRLVVDAVSDAHIAGPQHNWRLDLPDEPVIVTGDVQRLHQVLANLLTNARNHTPPGTTVTTSISVNDREFATMAVVDDGPGIPPDLLPTVFDRFARGDSSRSRAAGSTGLGLSIVSAVVNAHHGSVSVASRPGRTEFVVRLPLAQPAGQQSPREQTNEPLCAPAEGRWTRSTVTQSDHSNATAPSNIGTEHWSA
jgi:two-component system OmpR family sensor kinase